MSEISVAKSVEKSVHTPAVDVFEGPESFLLRADLPGVGSGQVGLEVDKGELKLTAGPEAATWRFERSFALPETVDVEGVQAKLEHGVLEVTLPKRSEARPRQIKVHVG